METQPLGSGEHTESGSPLAATADEETNVSDGPSVASARPDSCHFRGAGLVASW